MKKLLSQYDDISERMHIEHRDGVEHYQYRGRIILEVGIKHLARHLLTIDNLEPSSNLVVVARNHRSRWVANHASLKQAQVTKVFGEDDGKALWGVEPGLVLCANDIRIYNPDRDKNRHLPICHISHKYCGSCVLTDLSCDEDEAAGIIRELIDLHIVADSDISLKTFISETPAKKRESTPKPPKTEPPKLEKPIPDWFRPSV